MSPDIRPGCARYTLGRFGEGYVAAQNGCVIGIWLPGYNGESRFDLRDYRMGDPDAERFAKMLCEFDRTGCDISKIPFALPSRVTAFQRAVLAECHSIPYGKTWSYKDLARAAGRPKGSQAIGQVMAMNPIPLIIPCHRVVKADGTLGNFGGGVPMKEYLLRLERAIA